MNRKGLIVGSAGLLLLAGCQNIPYYDESLNWFSWSEYDPEVKAIEAGIPPPGSLAAPANAPARPVARPSDGGGRAAPATAPRSSASPGLAPQAAGSGLDVAGGISVADSSIGGPPSSDPPVGIRSSVGPSVTWRSPRGTP